ncbi:hypothetical protein KL86SPO_50574 [uncultured Sporomusa sp.]|uniref:Uncharacterized protein n=1 Tax=uncultured Sporomusa sp. TaxID=307249 RepID=A0A212LZ29_9FIRM|nr:hypothetical protein KL86SPO_50574 [uncultured Sporomusa sp.]
MSVTYQDDVNDIQIMNNINPRYNARSPGDPGLLTLYLGLFGNFVPAKVSHHIMEYSIILKSSNEAVFSLSDD